MAYDQSSFQNVFFSDKTKAQPLKNHKHVSETILQKS